MGKWVLRAVVAAIIIWSLYWLGVMILTALQGGHV